MRESIQVYRGLEPNEPTVENEPWLIQLFIWVIVLPMLILAVAYSWIFDGYFSESEGNSYGGTQ